LATPKFPKDSGDFEDGMPWATIPSQIAFFKRRPRYSEIWREPFFLMPKERSNIRVLIADDHAIFRDGLRKLLGSDESISIAISTDHFITSGLPVTKPC
jgi:hypothetical protein